MGAQVERGGRAGGSVGGGGQPSPLLSSISRSRGEGKSESERKRKSERAGALERGRKRGERECAQRWWLRVGPKGEGGWGSEWG